MAQERAREREMQESIEQGARNAALIPRLERWCNHLKVEMVKVVTEMEAWLVEQMRITELLRTIDPEVLAAAVECLESPLYAGRFLTTPAPSLGDKIPAEVAMSAEGKKQVMMLIRAFENGAYL